MSDDDNDAPGRNRSEIRSDRNTENQDKHENDIQFEVTDAGITKDATPFSKSDSDSTSESDKERNQDAPIASILPDVDSELGNKDVSDNPVAAVEEGIHPIHAEKVLRVSPLEDDRIANPVPALLHSSQAVSKEGHQIDPNLHPMTDPIGNSKSGQSKSSNGLNIDLTDPGIQTNDPLSTLELHQSPSTAGRQDESQIQTETLRNEQSGLDQLQSTAGKQVDPHLHQSSDHNKLLENEELRGIPHPRKTKPRQLEKDGVSLGVLPRGDRGVHSPAPPTKIEHPDQFMDMSKGKISMPRPQMVFVGENTEDTRYYGELHVSLAFRVRAFHYNNYRRCANISNCNVS